MLLAQAIHKLTFWGLLLTILASLPGLTRCRFRISSALGFGHIEVGTVTPKPQPGNDKPRLFRYPKDEALINRMGFNNDGAKKLCERLKATYPKGKRSSPLGVNIGKGKETPIDEACRDYNSAFDSVAEQADYNRQCKLTQHSD